MKYSDETISAIEAATMDFGSRFLLNEAVVREVLEALESTDEQKALRAFEKAYVKWAMAPGGGHSEGDAFVDLVEAYDAVLKAREE